MNIDADLRIDYIRKIIVENYEQGRFKDRVMRETCINEHYLQDWTSKSALLSRFDKKD